MVICLWLRECYDTERIRLVVVCISRFWNEDSVCFCPVFRYVLHFVSFGHYSNDVIANVFPSFLYSDGL